MELSIPEITELKQQIQELKELISDSVRLDQEWYDLEQACRLKGVNKSTLYAKPKYQPSFGKADALVCGKKRWNRSTIQEWLKMTDSDIPAHMQ